MDKIEKAYLKVISENRNSLIKSGKITKSSFLDTNKEDIENPLYGNTYGELEKIALQISKNINGYDTGEQIICPICGETLIKNTARQWGHVNNNLNHVAKDGKKFKVRNCAVKWNDALKALDKQYPDDNGEAVKKLKVLAK